MKRIALFSLALIAATSVHASVTISNAKTKNMSCTGGVCTPTGGNANLNVGELQTKLASSYVIVRSNAAAPDIAVADPLTWASTHPLTLDAYQSIHVKAPVIVEGTSRLTLITNDGGVGGDYTFNASGSGSITFWDTASHLVINGTRYKLVKYLATLASDIAADPYGNFALAASHDASVDGVYDNAPILTTFYGTFEGSGNTLSNLTVAVSVSQGKHGVGLFYDNRGLVRDVTLVQARMSGLNDVSGTIAANNEGWIKHVSSLDGTVESPSLAGGLVGINGGEIESSSSGGSVSIHRGGAGGGLAATNSGTISFSDSAAAVEADAGFQASVGGITGSNTGTIEFASASGKIAGPVAGGIAGSSSGSISYCRASGKVTVNPPGHRAAPKMAGGLVGSNFGSIAQSYASGSVSAPSNDIRPALIGGLVGSDGSGTISDSYATGSVSGNDVFAGGLVGMNHATAITQTYATGKIDAVPQGSVGGLIGEDDSNAGSNALDYWNLDTSGISNPHQGAGNIADDPGITGLTNLRMRATLPDGFDPNVWGQSASINNGWPYLLANPPPQ